MGADFTNVTEWQEHNRESLERETCMMNGIAECNVQCAMADFQCSLLTTLHQEDKKCAVTSEEVFYLKRMCVCVLYYNPLMFSSSSIEAFLKQINANRAADGSPRLPAVSKAIEIAKKVKFYGMYNENYAVEVIAHHLWC